MEQVRWNTNFCVFHTSHTGIHCSQQGKIPFPIYFFNSQNGSHTLPINNISKLPQKKNSATCFVGSSQCNSISHLSFNLLFTVAEHSETYYPEFPLGGVQQQQAPIKPGYLFFMLQLYSHQGQDGSICILILNDLPEQEQQQLLVTTMSTPTRKTGQHFICHLISFHSGS